MMNLLERLPGRRRAETGATLVEFALVAPVVFMLIFGLLAGSFLVYQNSALHDGATAGARMASVEASSTATLVNSNTAPCETGQPVSIEKAVAQAAPLLTVNPAPLCETSPTELTQGTDVNGDVNITVDCITYLRRAPGRGSESHLETGDQGSGGADRPPVPHGRPRARIRS